MAIDLKVQVLLVLILGIPLKTWSSAELSLEELEEKKAFEICTDLHAALERSQQYDFDLWDQQLKAITHFYETQKKAWEKGISSRRSFHIERFVLFLQKYKQDYENEVKKLKLITLKERGGSKG